MPLSADQLIPPPALLQEYAVTDEQFIQQGIGFVRGFLIPRTLLPPHGNILDLGCGSGPSARAWADYLSREGSFDGLDISQSAIDYCKVAYEPFGNFKFHHANIFNEHYNPTATLRQADYRLPFEDGRFDLISSVSLFTHLLPDDAQGYFKEVRRVLKPNGRFIATFFLLTAETLANIANPARPAAFRFPEVHGSCRVMSLDDLAAAVAYPEVLVRETLRECGLRVEETVYGSWSGEQSQLNAFQDIVTASPREA